MKGIFRGLIISVSVAIMHSLMIPSLKVVKADNLSCEKKIFSQIWRKNLWFHGMTFNCIVIFSQLMAYFYWIYLQGINVKQRIKLIRFLRSLTLILIRYSCNRTIFLTQMDLFPITSSYQNIMTWFGEIWFGSLKSNKNQSRTFWFSYK